MTVCPRCGCEYDDGDSDAATIPDNGMCFGCMEYIHDADFANPGERRMGDAWEDYVGGSNWDFDAVDDIGGTGDRFPEG